MRAYFRVGPSFWTDHASWDDDARLLALYILTCPHRTTEGLFRLPKAYAMDDLRWSSQRFAKPFQQLLTDGFIKYDEDASICWIVNALKWQSPENPNQARAAAKALVSLPKTPLLREFLTVAQTLCERLMKELPEGLAEGIGKPPSPSPSPSPTPPSPPGGGAAGAAQRVASKDVELVFETWTRATGRSRAVLDKKRRKLIRERLRQFPVDDLVAAVRGWRHSAHHRGENDRRTVYNDLGLLLRSVEHVERFRDLELGASQPRRSSSAFTIEQKRRDAGMCEACGKEAAVVRELRRGDGTTVIDFRCEPCRRAA